MANKANKVGLNFVYNGISSYPLTKLGFELRKDSVIVKNRDTEELLYKYSAGDEVNDVPVATLQEIFDLLTAFNDGGGGAGEGVPAGTERDVLTYNSEGVSVAKPLGWRQFSDLPTPPPFSNGVFIGTAFNTDGTALFGFLEMAMSGVESFVLPNAFPVYNPGIIGNGGGTLPVANAINDGDAVNLNQLNSRVPIPPVSGTAVLRSVDGVVSWVAE